MLKIALALFYIGLGLVVTAVSVVSMVKGDPAHVYLAYFAAAYCYLRFAHHLVEWAS